MTLIKKDPFFVFIFKLNVLLPLFCIPVFQDCTAQNGWTIYNTTNSPIPENSVRCILIDHNNVKWIGTDYGLASFDGTTWNVYQTINSGIPDNSVRSLAEDHQNQIWVGTFSGGVAKFDGTNWTTYNTINSGLPDDFVRCLAIDTLGNKWIGTIGGLAWFDDVNWENYNTSNSLLGSNNIGALYVDPDDNSISIGTINGGLAIKNDTAWTAYTIWNSNLPDNTLLGLEKDTSGILWMATPAAGLSAHIGGITFLTLNTASSTIASNSLTGVSVAPGQSVWASSNDSGIVKREGINFRNYNALNSPLPDNFTHTVTVDDQGIVWIGTLQGGLVRFDESLYLSTGFSQTDSKVYVYPVPANNYLHVAADNARLFSVSVFDVNGKMILPEAGLFRHAEIETNKLENGVYHLKLLFEDGAIAFKKFLVIHSSK